MILKNSKGAALMQVLLVTIVLAGMSAMLLRATLSRTMTVRQTRRNVSTQIMADSCMAEVNSLWAAKSVATFRSDFEGDARGAYMYCDDYNNSGICTSTSDTEKHRFYDCSSAIDGRTYQVRAWLYDTKGENGEVDGYPRGEMTGKTAGGNMLQMVFEVIGSDGGSL